MGIYKTVLESRDCLIDLGYEMWEPESSFCSSTAIRPGAEALGKIRAGLGSKAEKFSVPTIDLRLLDT